MDVGWISQALNKFKLEKETLTPIIRILIWVLRPGKKQAKLKYKAKEAQFPPGQKKKKTEVRISS